MSLRWKIAIAVGAMAALATLAVGLLSYRAPATACTPRSTSSLDRRRGAGRRTPASPDWDEGGPRPIFYRAGLRPDGSVRFSTTPAWEPDPSGPPSSASHADPSSTRSTIGVDCATVCASADRLSNGAVQVPARSTEVDRVLHTCARGSIVLVVLVTAAAAAARLADRRAGSRRRCAG